MLWKTRTWAFTAGTAALTVALVGAWLGAQEAPDGPEGKRPEGKRPEGKRPEGKRPEGKRPEGPEAREHDRNREVVRVVKFDGSRKDIVEKLTKELAGKVKIAPQDDLKVIVLRGPANLVGEAERALAGQGRAIELVRLHSVSADKVVRLAKEVIPEGLEVTARPESNAVIFEGKPDAVQLAVQLAHQLDGRPPHHGPQGHGSPGHEGHRPMHSKDGHHGPQGKGEFRGSPGHEGHHPPHGKDGHHGPQGKGEFRGPEGKGRPPEGKEGFRPRGPEGKGEFRGPEGKGRPPEGKEGFRPPPPQGKEGFRPEGKEGFRPRGPEGKGEFRGPEGNEGFRPPPPQGKDGFRPPPPPRDEE